jgi:hypothetical protein
MQVVIEKAQHVERPDRCAEALVRFQRADAGQDVTPQSAEQGRRFGTATRSMRRLHVHARRNNHDALGTDAELPICFRLRRSGRDRAARQTKQPAVEHAPGARPDVVSGVTDDDGMRRHDAVAALVAERQAQAAQRGQAPGVDHVRPILTNHLAQPPGRLEVERPRPVERLHRYSPRGQRRADRPLAAQDAHAHVAPVARQTGREQRQLRGAAPVFQMRRDEQELWHRPSILGRGQRVIRAAR